MSGSERWHCRSKLLWKGEWWLNERGSTARGGGQVRPEELDMVPKKDPEGEGCANLFAAYPHRPLLSLYFLKLLIDHVVLLNQPNCKKCLPTS